MLAHLCLSCERDVMVNELAPGHQHDGDGMVVPALVLKDDSVPEKRMTIINSVFYFHCSCTFFYNLLKFLSLSVQKVGKS
jgi:hypothetical protein